MSIPTRRQLGLGALALAAGGAGMGAAWLRWRPTGADAAAEQTFWASRFESPDGALVEPARWRGSPLLVNFWATWCPPCVEELPLLNAFQREHAGRGWQVLGLAVDQPAAVRQFLQRLPLAFPVGMAGLAGAELSRSLGNAGGGLPYSLLWSRRGTLLERKLGQLSPADLARWAQAEV
jgi:thiol-disulfide isomerase/thioredoxin